MIGFLGPFGRSLALSHRLTLEPTSEPRVAHREGERDSGSQMKNSTKKRLVEAIADIRSCIFLLCERSLRSLRLHSRAFFSILSMYFSVMRPGHTSLVHMYGWNASLAATKTLLLIYGVHDKQNWLSRAPRRLCVFPNRHRFQFFSYCRCLVGCFMLLPSTS